MTHELNLDSNGISVPENLETYEVYFGEDSNRCLVNIEMDSVYIDANEQDHGENYKANLVTNMRFAFNQNILSNSSEECIEP